MDVCLLRVLLCCQVEISATSWSLVQESPTDCGASLCLIYKSHEWGGPGLRWGSATEKKCNYILSHFTITISALQLNIQDLTVNIYTSYQNFPIHIVCVLLGISPASDCDLPTFRNPLSVPSSKAGCRVLSNTEEIPKRTHTIFKTRRKFEFPIHTFTQATKTSLYIQVINRTFWKEYFLIF
jgi:hypothetical protein